MIGRLRLRKKKQPRRNKTLFLESLETRRMLSGIEILAAGSENTESMSLQIDGQTVRSWDNIGGNAESREFEKFVWSTDDTISADQVRIAFTNDVYDEANGIDANLRIDAILIDGVRFEAESPLVFSTGTWTPENGISPGNWESEYLHGDGFFQFAEPEGNPVVSTVTVHAQGRMGDEDMELKIGGSTVQSWTVSTDDATYQVTLNRAVTISDVRIEFTNDLFAPEQGIDRDLRVDKITIDGVDYETEADDVWSTGTWDGQFTPGYKESEWLHTSGYFQFGDRGSLISIHAEGQTGQEAFQLIIGEEVARQWTNASTDLTTYLFRAESDVVADDVRVSFINDGLDTFGNDKNLRVAFIRIDGREFQTDGANVFSTGTWTESDGVTPGYKRSQWLHTNGYFQYSEVTGLVNQLSAQSAILTQAVNYHWLVGCTPTAVAMMLGYWDRQGYDNLIDGDTSYYSEAIQNAIASPEHIANYANPSGTETFDDESSPTILRDRSEDGLFGAHENNSIADFLWSSRSRIGLDFGYSSFAWEGVGIHGYASYRGYDGFEASHSDWGEFTLEDIADEIDAGKPVILAVDSDADGRNDHNVMAIGYDLEANQVAFFTGWSTGNEPQWGSFAPKQSGLSFGITSATFVTPPNLEDEVDGVQSVAIVNDRTGTAAAYDVDFDSLQAFLREEDSWLGWGSNGFATADGHEFYVVRDDGAGTASLGLGLALGSGQYRYVPINNNSGLSRDTIGIATADGRNFFSLVDDGYNTAALYSHELLNDGTFTNQLLQADSGLGRSTVGFSTADGENFYQLINDGIGTASLYEVQIVSGYVSGWQLISEDSGNLLDTIGLASWV